MKHEYIMKEDAKSEWMRLVKKNRKKQRGLPALSTLNTNAGNVEHNINMFNMMQPSGNISVDASNGNISVGDACCESISEGDKYMNDTIILQYENLPVEVVTRKGNPGGYYSYDFGNYLPDEDETKEILVDWSYEVPSQEAIDFLQENEEVLDFLSLDYDIDDETLRKHISDNLEELVEKFEDYLKENFYESAVDDAQENYDSDYDYYEYYDEELEKNNLKQDNLDDSFDMSLRTLL